MSIFKDTFRPYVRKQLSLREELLDIGNTNDRGIRTNRLTNQKVRLQTGDEVDIQAGAHNTYTLNKQCIIRMTSLVDYVENVNLEIGGLEGINSFNALRGAALSQNFILEGGVLSDFARVRNGKREVRRVTTPRGSFPRPGQKTNIGYGDLAIGADASVDGYGIVPMPGIVDINVRTKSAYGSLREAKVNFECHNRRQLEVLEMLYMRPGYMVLLEWGWTPYVSNQGKIVNDVRLMEDISDGRIYTNNITQQEVFRYINQLKSERDGNYDGFMGFVKNFGFQARDDGGYTCYTELISIGEVIESLKIPNVSLTNPSITLGVNDPTSLSGESNIKIENNRVGGAYAGKAFVDQAKFNKALNAGVFPRYNGLLGLTKSLINYCTFNSFSRGNGKPNTTFEDQQIENIFNYVGYDNMVDAANSGEEAGKNVDKYFNDSKTAKSLARQSGYPIAGNGGQQEAGLKRYLTDLLQYQSADLEQFLIKKLQLQSAEELRNYIIPIGGAEDFFTVKNEQPYIRWDALCILINENLITKDAKNLHPVQLVADRVYDVGDGTSEIDPLLFTPITDYTKTPTNNLLDFSCDPNTCILPLQMQINTDPESTTDVFAIEDSLGYVPNISIFPTAYMASAFDRGLPLYYEGLPIGANAPVTPGVFPQVTLNDTDKLRRIGSIYINVNLLDNIAEKNADNEEYTLGQFLKDIWDEINKACPNHNFVVTDDKESNTIFVIDLPVDNSKIANDLHEFIPFSNKNILRKFEYTSNVPKAMSATIAIQSQDPRSIQDIDGVTFAAFNRSIKNRILSDDTNSNWGKTQAAISNNEDNVLIQQNSLRQQLDRYMLRFFRNLKAMANDEDPISEGNISSILKEYQKNAAYLSTAMTSVSTFNSVIPLEFSATLDGIAGVVIGNMFKVQKDRLPKAYANSNIGFIVFNEDQKVSGQDWTTNISGKMTLLPKPGNKPIISGITNSTYTDVSILTETSAVSPGSMTQALSTGQAEATDIGKATTGEDVYLKNIKDTSLRYIDRVGLSPDFYAIKYKSDETLLETGGSVYKPSGYADGKYYDKTRGYAFVRSSPNVNNGGVNNVVGAFNTWENKGLKLGFIKPYGGNLMPDGTIREGANTGMYANVYEGGQIRILPSAYNTYFPDQDVPDGVYFKPIETNGSNTEVIDGVPYYSFKSVTNANNWPIQVDTLDVLADVLIPAGDTENVKYVRVQDCSTIRNVWYNIQFYPETDKLFHEGWAMDGSDQIDTTLGQGYQNLLRSKHLSDISKNNGCWMRFDTLAASQASALEPGNMEIINGNNIDAE
jgi:hypothetical protein